MQIDPRSRMDLPVLKDLVKQSATENSVEESIVLKNLEKGTVALFKAPPHGKPVASVKTSQ